MKTIYKLHFDCGRMGSLDGIFIEEKEKVEELIESGREVWFGEVLGKHSEIFGPIESPEDITFITDDQKVIDIFEQYDLCTGYNPFDYLEDE